MDKAFSFKDVQIDMSDIPSYASLNEACLYVTEASNALFDNLKREIGLNELGIFEATGNTISYVVEAEGEEGKEGLKDKVINKGKDLKVAIDKIIDAIAKKIKGLFEAALLKMNEVVAKAYNVIGKQLDENKLIAALDKTEIKFTSGDYKNLKDFVTGNSEFYNLVFGSDPGEDINAKIAEEIGGDLTGSKLIEYFEGKPEEQTLDAAGVKDICTVIKDFKNNNGGIKKMYKDCSKIINDKKKEVKSAKEVDNDLLSAIKANFAAMSLVYGKALSCYYKLICQDVKLAVKLFATAKKAELKDKLPKKKEEKAAEAEAPKEEKAAEDVKVKESAVEESVTKTYTEEVESLFNWSF